MENLWIVVPTYNEAENVASLSQVILRATEGAPVDRSDLLFVDDNSPDDTGRVVDALAESDDRIHALHRPLKEGLGPAYIAGFGRALEGGADYVVEMDADFSHDPAAIPSLVERAVAGTDLVVGSRYVEGGEVANWGLGRRIVSRAGCFYARQLLSVDAKDLTGGFKCFRSATLTAIDYASVSSRGYAFQVEMTWRTAGAGLRIAEVPIRFCERRAGQSKMSAAIALEAAWRVPALRLRGRPARGSSGAAEPRALESDVGGSRAVAQSEAT